MENKIRRVCIACWIPKARNTHSEYVIPITFPLQQILHERASLLRCTCIVCLLIKLHYSLRTCGNIGDAVYVITNICRLSCSELLLYALLLAWFGGCPSV